MTVSASFVVGDLVKKTNGTAFSTGAEVETVERVDGVKIWLSSGYWAHKDRIKLAELKGLDLQGFLNAIEYGKEVVSVDTDGTITDHYRSYDALNNLCTSEIDTHKFCLRSEFDRFKALNSARTKLDGGFSEAVTLLAKGKTVGSDWTGLYTKSTKVYKRLSELEGVTDVVIEGDWYLVN